jgi:hypothetical protein
MTNRSAKQCRERYHNHLRADIKVGDWSPEEEDLIWQLASQCNHQWAMIAKSLPGRSASAIKNRWHLVNRKRSKQREFNDLSYRVMGLDGLWNEQHNKPSLDNNSIGCSATTSDISLNTSRSGWLSDSSSDTSRVVFTEEEEQDWMNLLLGSCSNDSWHVPERVDGSFASLLVPDAALASSQPEIEVESAQSQQSLRDHIQGMGSLTLNCAPLEGSFDSFDSFDVFNSTPLSSMKISNKASLFANTLLSPIHQRPSPIMQAKRQCQISTPYLSSSRRI